MVDISPKFSFCQLINNQNDLIKFDNHLARPDSLQLQGYQLFWEELSPEFVVGLESSRASHALLTMALVVQQGMKD